MKKQIFIILLGLILISIASISDVSAVEPYSVGMRNISDKLYNGKANVMIIGDSISVQFLAARWQYGAIHSWRPKQWRGIWFPSTSPQGSGTYFTSVFSSNSSSIEPGQSFGNNTNNINIQTITGFNFTQDLTNFATFGSQRIDSTYYSNWSNDWTNNTNLSARVYYYSTNLSTRLFFIAFLRNGSDGSNVLTAFNSTPGLMNFAEINITATTGNSDVGTYFTTSDFNESINKNFYPFGERIYRPDLSTGLQFGPNSGSGNWFSTCHFNGCNVNGYTGNYTDNAIQQYLNATESNIFIIHLGNPSADEPTNYTANVVTIINRYIRNYYVVNNISTSAKPMFILLSEYDRQNADTTRESMENQLENITRNQCGGSYTNICANSTLGFVAMRRHVNESLGAYTAWNATYLSDGLHQSFLGARAFMGYMWNDSMDSITIRNGTLDGINWSADSKTISNTTIGLQDIIFNNTDIYNQSLNITGTKTLMYTSNTSVICTNLVDSLQCPVSVSLPTVTLTAGQSFTVLNNYNITEGENRNGSLIWFASATNTTKHIASNFSQNITLTTQFYVTTCNNVNRIEYTPHNGNKITFSSGQFNCSNGKVTIPSITLSSSGDSNVLEIFASSSTDATTLNSCNGLINGFGSMGTLMGIIGILVFGAVAVVLVMGSFGQGSSLGGGESFSMIKGVVIATALGGIIIVVTVIIIAGMCT